MGWVGWLAHDIRKEETEAEEDEQAAEAGAEEGGEVEEIEARSKKQTVLYAPDTSPTAPGRSRCT
jgi:hypothetical protein